MRKRQRSEKGGILYDGADPAKLLSCGVDLPLHVSEQLLRGLNNSDPIPEEPAPPMKKGAAFRIKCNGQIRFEEMANGGIAIRQGWNPPKYDRADRGMIAAILRDIANNIENDHFEDDGEYRHYPIDG